MGLNEACGGLLEAHGGHGRAILAGLLAGGLRWWIIGGFFRALALGTPRLGRRSRRSWGGAAVCSSDERDEFGFWTPLVDIEAAADGSKRSRRHRSRATSVPAPPPGKAHRWQWGNWGKSGGTWPAAAPLAFALGLFTALPERISYTVGRELMCLKSFSLRARLGGSTTVSSEAGGPNGLELPRNATKR